MPIFIAIIGQSGSRKSSTIRALTGVHRGTRNWEIARCNTSCNGYQTDIYDIEITSLQENKAKKKEIESLAPSGTNNILVSLRPTAMAQNIIDLFLSHSWNVHIIEFNGSNFSSKNAYIHNTITNTTTKPSNLIACEIRKILQWC
jgi:ABC-type dipeptide/oligopeptide/nickel transport system ATPase component